MLPTRKQNSPHLLCHSLRKKKVIPSKTFFAFFAGQSATQNNHWVPQYLQTKELPHLQRFDHPQHWLTLNTPNAVPGNDVHHHQHVIRLYSGPWMLLHQHPIWSSSGGPTAPWPPTEWRGRHPRQLGFHKTSGIRFCNTLFTLFLDCAETTKLTDKKIGK